MLTKSTHTPRESYGRKGPNQPLAWLDHALFLSCPKLLEIGISFKIGGGTGGRGSLAGAGGCPSPVCAQERLLGPFSPTQLIRPRKGKEDPMTSSVRKSTAGGRHDGTNDCGRLVGSRCGESNRK